MLEDTSPLLDYFLYRPQFPNFDRQFSSGEWTEVIDHLMAAGYDFKPEQFNGDGYLFRGMSCGFLKAFQQQKFEHYSSSAETNRAEQILQIYFVTHNLSDAVTASSLYDNHQDNVVLVFKSSLFNLSLQLGEAAVLNVGDMGVIFRYPFLTQHLALADVDYIIVNESIIEQVKTCLPEFSHRILSVSLGEHNGVLNDAKKCLQAVDVSPTKPEKSELYPCFRKYRKPSTTGFVK